MSNDKMTKYVPVFQNVKPANPKRGEPYREAAGAFIATFPIGTKLIAEAFDDWASSCGLLVVPLDAPRKSDAWQAHLQRRHQLRYNINRAGSHPRMSEDGHTPFVIETVRRGDGDRVQGQLIVRAPQDALAQTLVIRDVEKLVVTKRKQLRYLRESLDWEALTPEARLSCDMITDEIDAMKRELELKVSILGERLARLEARIRRSVEIGEVVPRNGGIKAITDGVSDEDEKAFETPPLHWPEDGIDTKKET